MSRRLRILDTHIDTSKMVFFGDNFGCVIDIKKEDDRFYYGFSYYCEKEIKNVYFEDIDVSEKRWLKSNRILTKYSSEKAFTDNESKAYLQRRTRDYFNKFAYKGIKNAV